MKTTSTLELSFLIALLESNHKKLFLHLTERNTLELFYEKCKIYCSDELKEFIKKMPDYPELSDGAQANYFEEIKVKLLSKAIKRLKPFFYTI